MDGFDTSHDGAGVSAFYLDYAAFEEIQVKALGAGADTPNAGSTFQGIVKSGGNRVSRTLLVRRPVGGDDGQQPR